MIRTAAGKARLALPALGIDALDRPSVTKMAPRVGFEPTTNRLTAGCSTAELPRNDGHHLEAALLAEKLCAG